MKRFALVAMIALFLCPPAFAVPMLVNYSFSGYIEPNETTEMFDIADSFSGLVSYIYDESFIERAIENDRNWLIAGEVNLSYYVEIGDFSYYNYFTSLNDPVAHVSFDVIASFLDQAPKYNGLFVDEFSVSIETSKIFLTGVNLPVFLPSVSGVIDNLEFNMTPVPEPGTLLLIGCGLLGVIGKRKFPKSR